MQLVLAEDDQALGRAICVFMMRDGHAVDWVANGNELLSLIGQSEVDCILLDLGLPEISGRDCLINLRAGGDATPVIVTTAHGHRDHRIQLLDLGADDYLVKPFDLMELSARVQAIVRRSSNAGSTGDRVQVHGPLSLFTGTNQVTWRDQLIELTTTELKILSLLVRRQGQTVSRAQLESEICGRNGPAGGNSIEVHVHHLRRKIDPGLIQTQRGLGYQLRLDLGADANER